jgi:predicted secreted protein
MIEAKAEEIQIQAEARAAEAAEKPVDVTKGDSEEPVETLESVNLPEPPETFGGGGRGR